ncbi:far upstream element-binding protein 2 protein [Pyrenophora tritici-repentis]|nr:far upstream element-binding protein 2 protein [Pyrenophora tritici-repentis]KAI0586846.1 far upstream element-binding protein 2 protein [Pyrenophora tritici-repentis]KAI0611743.1 far upstream element-binding protein 2 protein [Pyrenophora tritici-repentis]KAI0623910.1 far upstream element-binding protein 2 protein [Pyrenophora tritici-repentis]
MATPDLNAILAALAAHPSATPSAAPQQPQQAQHAPPQGLPAGFPGAMPSATPPAMHGYNFPTPTHSGSLDLSAIKPVSSGSVSIEDALAKARGFAAQKGLAHEARPGISEPWSGYGVPAQTYTAAAYQEDPRLSGRQPYRRSRSRSRSPVRREAARESYNPYRDERRDERRGGYGRERDRSPPRRDTFSPSQQYGQARSPPANDNSEVILIDSSLVGLVIGRQGESLRRIEQESQTRIQFINGPESGPQRECRITGSPGARISAKREINRIIEENGGNPARETGRNARPAAKTVGQQQPALREGEQSSQIMVPDRTVGLIIGRGGETIRDLQERSGCHVNIVGENKSVNGLRPVNLIGSPTAAAHAKELIMEIVDSDTKQMEGSGGQQPQPQQQFNNRRETFDPYGGGTAAGAAAGKINDSIHVPSDAVGMIIGKGGETIKSMQSETGCKINVSQASGADIEREIGLVGTRQAIDDAKRAIWEKVDQVVSVSSRLFVIDCC